MTVKQIMRKELVTVLPSSSVYDSAVKMKEYGVGSILVVEEGFKLKGIVTDRDIALTVGTDLGDPKAACVCDIMTPDPITIDADADIDSALRIMHRANIRRLPVVENGKLTGILSTADLAAEIKDEFDKFISLEEAFAKH
ncbi:MAG: cyclic nucleotide-binding/CBS domain-containing protein [bacterium]